METGTATILKPDCLFFNPPVCQKRTVVVNASVWALTLIELFEYPYTWPTKWSRCATAPKCSTTCISVGKLAGHIHGLPSVILLDLKMPKVDGLEVLRQIKGDPKLKIVPVVMMTSSREEQDLFKSYQLGVNAYVVKPVRFHEFVEAVKQLAVFWAVLNESPPNGESRPGGAAARVRSEPSALDDGE